jgi:S1-C subfamily serine protease
MALTATGLLLVFPVAGWSQPATAVGGSVLPATKDSALLPESYPWPQLAEKLGPAIVNIRTTGERSQPKTAREEMIPEPFRRFFPPGFAEERPKPDQRPFSGVGTGFVIDPMSSSGTTGRPWTTHATSQRW